MLFTHLSRFKKKKSYHMINLGKTPTQNSSILTQITQICCNFRVVGSILKNRKKWWFFVTCSLPNYVLARLLDHTDQKLIIPFRNSYGQTDKESSLFALSWLVLRSNFLVDSLQTEAYFLQVTQFKNYKS